MSSDLEADARLLTDESGVVEILVEEVGTAEAAVEGNIVATPSDLD